MPKKEKLKHDKAKEVNFAEEVMAKINSDQITMKPRWYFVLGSFLSFVSLIGLFIVAVFFSNVLFFLLRSHGPMGNWKLQIMLNDFPWWVAIAAVGGMALGVRLLKKYDFSYKKNFSLIVIGFIFSIIIAGLVIDQIGLNETWSRHGPMKRFYHQIEMRKDFAPRGRVRHFHHKNHVLNQLNK